MRTITILEMIRDKSKIVPINDDNTRTLERFGFKIDTKKVSVYDYVAISDGKVWYQLRPGPGDKEYDLVVLGMTSDQDTPTKECSNQLSALSEKALKAAIKFEVNHLKELRDNYERLLDKFTLDDKEKNFVKNKVDTINKEIVHLLAR